MERVREKIRLGLKATSRFSIQATIQKLYDLRSIVAKLVQILTCDGLNELFPKKYDTPTLLKVYASGYINTMLRKF